MRCNNCGWENPDGVSVCEKCRAHLSRPDAPGNVCHVEEPQSLRGTVSERKVFGGCSESENGFRPNEPSPRRECPKCGYPLRQGVKVCPSCGFLVSDNPTSPNVNGMCGISRPGTVNPYKNIQNNPCCTMTPVARDNEQNVPTPIVLSGSDTVLNRDNTDPGNQTITSREQAHLTCENGAWYIEDRSDLKTTFVRAGRKTMLEDGDIILLGNRMFEFKSGK